MAVEVTTHGPLTNNREKIIIVIYWWGYNSVHGQKDIVSLMVALPQALANMWLGILLQKSVFSVEDV